MYLFLDILDVFSDFIFLPQRLSSHSIYRHFEFVHIQPEEMCFMMQQRVLINTSQPESVLHFDYWLSDGLLLSPPAGRGGSLQFGTWLTL